MFPQIPENLQALSAAELDQLSEDIRKAALGVFQSAESTEEARAEARAFTARREEIKALSAQKKVDAALAETLAGDEPQPEPQPELVPAGAPATEAAAGDEPQPDPAPIATPGTFGMPSTPTSDIPATPSLLAQVVRYDGPGVKDGDGFDSWQELAESLYDRAQNIRANTSEKFSVAKIKAKYDPSRVLGDDAVLNMAKFEPDEIQAALCAPATPYYGLACANTLRRPVFGSLPQFQAPRMKVSIPESPSLSDIITGVGQWTAENDADNDAVKLACQTIACGTPTEYVMYGVYRCLTVKNMLAMSNPELMEAYLNRLGAAHARLGDQLLLNAMATGCVEIDGRQLGYGGSVSIVTTILNYIALYQETERWDAGNMVAWVPRWVLWAMKMDIARRRRTDGGFSVPSDGQIEAMFREVGISNVTWYIDTPSYAVAIPSIASASTLNLLPASVQVMIAPAGKFAVMDRGELAIGVTGNNIYRDNQSNSRNEFTFFFENFEGIVNTTSCPAHIIDIPACWSGVQIDDIAINCQGGDEVGYQS